MTALERRSRLLLRAYPAQYRQDRGEEILGTLLEATPAERSWPLARDVRALVLGGLRARAELNKQRTTSANLRTAALVGATAYFAFGAVEILSWVVYGLAAPPPLPARVPVWPGLTALVLVGMAVAFAWLSSRRAVVLAGVIAAAVAVVVSAAVSQIIVLPQGIGVIVVDFACLAALALQAGRSERPGRRWLLPLALVAALPLVSYLLPGVSVTLSLGLLEILGGASLAWMAIDARPAIATSVFVLAQFLPAGVVSLVEGPDIPAALPSLIVIAVVPLAVWRLRRQSAHVTAGRGS